MGQTAITPLDVHEKEQKTLTHCILLLVFNIFQYTLAAYERWESYRFGL